MATIALTMAVPDRTGAARMLANFSAALRRRGHRVIVLHGPPPVDPTGRPQTILSDLDDGVETREVQRLRRPLPILTERDLARAATEADAIVGFNQRDRAAAARTGSRLGIPALLAVQNQHTFWGRMPVRQLKRRFYQRAIRGHVTLSICTCEAVQDELVAMGVDGARCAVLPNGIDLPPLRSDTGAGRDALRSALGLGGGTRVFVTVGRLDVQKGQDLLLEAWARAGAGDRDAHLLIVGGVSEGAQTEASTRFRKSLTASAERLGIGSSVSFLGWREDVARLLTASDVYIHPARWEGWPLAVMEAMAASRPVIMTDCSGSPLGHREALHGPILPAGDADALSSAIVDFLDRPTIDLRVMGSHCRDLVERNYHMDDIGDRFVDHVEWVLAGA